MKDLDRLALELGPALDRFRQPARGGDVRSDQHRSPRFTARALTPAARRLRWRLAGRSSAARSTLSCDIGRSVSRERIGGGLDDPAPPWPGTVVGGRLCLFA